jgi:peroxiredoxin Q/BCP
LRDRIGEFEERGAQVIAIAPDTIEHAQAHFQRNDIPFACLADPDRKVFRQYDVKSAMISLGQRPGLFIIDSDGAVRYAYLGFQQWEIPSIDDTLAELDKLSAP